MATAVIAHRRTKKVPKKHRGQSSARHATTAPPLDPVSQYARDVLDGRIVAGRAVRLTCERHFRDLRHQCTTEFPYYFDQAAARRIIDFFPAFLTLENGDPFVLPPWLQFCYGSIFGWKRVDEATLRLKKRPPVEELNTRARRWLRRFRHGFFETSKGSGKTPSAGGVGLYGLAFDGEGHSEIYSTGFDKGQAAIILNDAIRMAEHSPDDDFRAEFVVDKYNIAHPASGSFFRAMSSQHQSKSGPRPQYVLSDEIHEQRNGTVVSKAEAGFKFRTQPLGLKYTNSGFAIAKLSLAINRRVKKEDTWQEEANFFDAVMMGKRAEALAQYLQKGKQIAVEGELRQDRWEQEGQRRSRVEIFVTNIQLLGGRAGAPAQEPAGGEEHPPQGVPTADNFDDDIPF